MLRGRNGVYCRALASPTPRNTQPLLSGVQMPGHLRRVWHDGQCARGPKMAHEALLVPALIFYLKHVISNRRSPKMSLLKEGQRINVLVFAGCTLLFAMTHLCSCGQKAAKDNSNK